VERAGYQGSLAGDFNGGNDRGTEINVTEAVVRRVSARSFIEFNKGQRRSGHHSGSDIAVLDGTLSNVLVGESASLVCGSIMYMVTSFGIISYPL
jgi:hypothetical protein